MSSTRLSASSHRQHEGVLLPVLGHVGDAGVETLAGRGVR